MRSNANSIRGNFLLGAISGSLIWAIYGVVECFFSSILPQMIWPNLGYRDLHHGFASFLFIIYPILGFILGGIIALCTSTAVSRLKILQRIEPLGFSPAVGAFTVVLAYSLNLTLYFRTQISALIFYILCISILLMLCTILSIGSDTWSQRLSFMVNPWAMTIILVGMPWIAKDLLKFHSYSNGLRAGASFAFLLLILSISFLYSRFGKRRRSRLFTATKSAFRIRLLAPIAAAMALTLGASIFLNQIPSTNASLSPLSLSQKKRPNVILIVMDTVRADHMSLYGYQRNTAPNLGQFANDATLYLRSVSASDMTLPTHASIFTGMYPTRHGAHYPYPNRVALTDPDYCMALDDRYETLAETLLKAGYYTSAVSANYGWLAPVFRLDQGFQYYDPRVPVHWSAQSYYLRYAIGKFLNGLSPYHVEPQRAFRNALEINTEIFALLNRLKNRGGPFFIFINYMDAHFPYLPPSPFDKYYGGKYGKFTAEHYNRMKSEVMKLERDVKDVERNHLISQYDGGIAYLDYHIGRLLDRLKELELYENSIIIITSDHGEAFGERGFIDHGVSVYQDQVYVPLIIKYPNIANKSIVRETVSSVDLMPTIMDVLGIDLEPDVQGYSLIRSDINGSRYVISESFPKGGLVSWHPRFSRMQRAVFSGALKFINSSEGKPELYDLSGDPNETKNIYNSNESLAQELEMKLRQWLQSAKPLTKEPSLPAKLDRETRERLRSLGYVK